MAKAALAVPRGNNNYSLVPVRASICILHRLSIFIDNLQADPHSFGVVSIKLIWCTESSLLPSVADIVQNV